ncbi:response regulator [Roseospirillum parvum]|uniref:CheY chemotaxis protein or a CheY-like REC (Receiver) domain n=1 Tax=Roseospirillum parvum TaxID=83401 RepID=A0A1G8G464_9PROT|nr:response regulator [Roseospirillum parvum]SDH89080.1 CheY chemotaxis protein or a CheY-like REC (receiver) domain [Roseospirillum parvum]
MSGSRQPVTILMADDDDADVMLARKALAEVRLANDFHHVRDGQELLDYLYREGRYGADTPRPALVLLDLNMPVMDGRQALERIKADPSLRRIPVIVLTTSKAEEDIVRTYELGCNSYITKPVTFEGLVQAMKVVESYWLEIVTLPGG